MFIKISGKVDAGTYDLIPEGENAKLKEFARKTIMGYCWEMGDPDGGDIQELAEKCGLIEPHIATAEEVDDEWSDYEVGDTIFKLTDIFE